MATGRLKVLLDDGGGEFEQVGSTKSFTFTEKREIREVVNDEAKVLWDAAASGALGDFDFAVLWADGVVDVEMTINNGDGNEELNSLRLAANTPLVLGADDAYDEHSANDAFAGTLDVIDLIRVDEPNATDVTVYLLLFT